MSDMENKDMIGSLENDTPGWTGPMRWNRKIIRPERNRNTSISRR